MKLSLLFLLPLLLLLSALLCPSSAELCHPQDKKVLLEIKKAFNDPYVLSSWNPDTDCCDWYCVECDLTTHRITSLVIITDNKISGPIPPQVGDLPFLQTLVFHKLPNITGPIQPAIAKLKSLEFLRLSWTNISGSVPDFLSQLKNLTFLDLSFNNLTGSIPSSLSLLPNLGAIHLDRNKLTGSIPASFGKFQGSIPDLYLSHNQLTGKIPASLGKLDFSTIDFSRNKLEGDASMLFGSNKTTFSIDLSRNMLEFDLSKVEIPKNLQYLDLNHNRITGSIPVGFTADSNLQFFNVSYNRLCGEIPVGGKLQSFDYSSYFHNKCLCGAPLSSCK
ncbi:hypothetical protein SLA2020_114960 [Shorea laevis]